jgi:hypothetical protein
MGCCPRPPRCGTDPLRAAGYQRRAGAGACSAALAIPIRRPGSEPAPRRAPPWQDPSRGRRIRGGGAAPLQQAAGPAPGQAGPANPSDLGSLSSTVRARSSRQAIAGRPGGRANPGRPIRAGQPGRGRGPAAWPWPHRAGQPNNCRTGAGGGGTAGPGCAKVSRIGTTTEKAAATRDVSRRLAYPLTLLPGVQQEL